VAPSDHARRMAWVTASWSTTSSGQSSPSRSVNVQEELPVYVLGEDAVRERLVDAGSGLFLLPGALVDDEEDRD
jgi:hypothetical protein